LTFAGKDAYQSGIFPTISHPIWLTAIEVGMAERTADSMEAGSVGSPEVREE
jgi:hypothetical protein